MKTTLLFLLFVFVLVPSYSQDRKWAANIGIEGGTDAAFGLAGVSTLKTAENPLVSAADLKRTYAFSADLYLEFLKLGSRRNTEYGSIRPTFGIKTKMEWSFYNADNTMNGDGGTETFGLNYAAVPLLFEYCVGYHQGVTRASHTPGTTTYTGRSNRFWKNRYPDMLRHFMG